MKHRKRFTDRSAMTKEQTKEMKCIDKNKNKRPRKVIYLAFINSGDVYDPMSF